jgi:AraC-like DNA-binding protein
LIIFRDKPHTSNIWLALFFASNAFYVILTNSLLVDEKKWIVSTFFPYFVSFNSSSGVFLYFYFLLKLKPERKITSKDLWHFLIPLILFINSTPFIFLKTEFKDQLLHSIQANPSNLVKIPTLLFGYYYQTAVRPISSFIYVLICGFLLWKSHKRDAFKFVSAYETRFLVILIALSLIHYFTSVTSLFNLLFIDLSILSQELFDRMIFIPRAAYVLILLSIWFFPQIIFQKFFPSSHSETHIFTKKSNAALPQYDLDAIHEVVKEYLKEKPCLKPGFSLFKFAEETKIPQHQLTYYLKVKYDQTFNDFKNFVRIQHAIELLESGVAKNHTLETISITCGFRSRTNFIESFKKVTGKTPSDYLKA